MGNVPRAAKPRKQCLHTRRQEFTDEIWRRYLAKSRIVLLASLSTTVRALSTECLTCRLYPLAAKEPVRTLHGSPPLSTYLEFQRILLASIIKGLLRVEVSGPDLTHFTTADLPRIIGPDANMGVNAGATQNIPEDF